MILPSGKTHISDSQCLGNLPNLLDIKSVKIPRRVLCGQLVVQSCRGFARCAPFGPEFDDDGSRTVNLEMCTSMVSSRPWRREAYHRVEVGHGSNVGDRHCGLYEGMCMRNLRGVGFLADPWLSGSLTFYTQLACSALSNIVSY